MMSSIVFAVAAGGAAARSSPWNAGDMSASDAGQLLVLVEVLELVQLVQLVQLGQLIEPGEVLELGGSSRLCVSELLGLDGVPGDEGLPILIFLPAVQPLRR